MIYEQTMIMLDWALTYAQVKPAMTISLLNSDAVPFGQREFDPFIPLRLLGVSSHSRTQTSHIPQFQGPSIDDAATTTSVPLSHSAPSLKLRTLLMTLFLGKLAGRVVASRS